MSLPSRMMGAYPSIQVSTLLSGTLSTPSQRGPWSEGTMNYIASSTPAGTTTATFSSIPSTYKHLVIHAHAQDGRTNNPIDGGYVRYNGDTGGNYRYSYTNASVTTHSGGSQGNNATFMMFGAIGTLQGGDGFGAGLMYIFDYASTTLWKTMVQVSGAANDTAYGEIMIGGGLWKSASAITSISIVTETGSNYSTGTRFDLYGLASV